MIPLAIAAAIAGFAAGAIIGERRAWRHARYWTEHYGRLPLDSTPLEPRRRRRARTAARHRHPTDSGHRRRRTDRAATDTAWTAGGVALVALVVTSGALVEALAALLEAGR